MTGAKANILEAVGGTPIVKLQKLARHVAADIYVKCEYLNPGGSMKDRVARNIVTDAERRGLLGPGGTIVEATSGNTGMGLALVAALRGYAMRVRHAGQDVAREGGRAAGLRRARGDLPDRRRARGSAQLLPDGQADRGRDAGRLLRQPVPQPRQPRRALQLDGAGDLGADQRRGRRLRRRHGDRRDDLGLRALLQGEEAGLPSGGRRPDRLALLRVREDRADDPAVRLLRRGDRRGLPAEHDEPQAGRRDRARRRQGVLPHDARAGAPGGAVRRRQLGRGGGGRHQVRRGDEAQGEHPGAAPRRRVQVPVEDLRRQVDARERLPRRARSDGHRRRAPAPQEAPPAHHRQEGGFGPQRDRLHARRRRLADAGAGERRGAARRPGHRGRSAGVPGARARAGSTRRSIRWSSRTMRR